MFPVAKWARLDFLLDLFFPYETSLAFMILMLANDVLQDCVRKAVAHHQVGISFDRFIGNWGTPEIIGVLAMNVNSTWSAGFLVLLSWALYGSS